MSRAKYLFVTLAVLLMGLYGLTQVEAATSPDGAHQGATLNQGGTCPAGTSGPPMTMTYDFNTGAQGWVSTTFFTEGVSSPFVLSSANPAPAPAGGQNWFAPNVEGTGGHLHEARLTSPRMGVATGAPNSTFSFYSRRNYEPSDTECWDMSFLEASTDNGATWTHVPASAILVDPYDLPLHVEYTPEDVRFSGQPGWCPTGLEDWHQTVVNMAPWAGQQVTFRHIFFSDNASAVEGMNFDQARMTNVCMAAATAVTLDGFGSQAAAPWGLPLAAAGLLGLAGMAAWTRRKRA